MYAKRIRGFDGPSHDFADAIESCEPSDRKTSSIIAAVADGAGASGMSVRMPSGGLQDDVAVVLCRL